MKSGLYCITDTKANRTTDPFSCPSDESAKRNFLFGCFGSETPPQDCVLWKIGDFTVDDTDSTCFSYKQCENGFKVLNPSVEEIDAYRNIYESYFGGSSESEDFNEFQHKGVI